MRDGAAWTYVRDERPWNSQAPPAAWYRFSTGRKGTNPTDHLTGFEGWMHADGYIELRDRSKDIIISGGENISTIEVENTLYQHPDVLEVAVVSMPHEKWGEVPKAFIAPKPGTSPSEADIQGFVRERLAAFKVPKAVEFCELPKTATGKIQKFKLREKEWSGKGRVIQGVEVEGD